MFIDYVSILLINMAAGFILLAWFLFRGLDGDSHKSWVPAFAMTGLVALASGFHMIQNWPLPGSFNSAFGEMSVFLGVLFLGAALALACGWNLFFVGVYGFFAGLASLIIGIRILDLGLTKEPLLAGIGFILSGCCGIFAAPLLHLRNNRSLRAVGAVVLVLAALIWLRTGYKAYWSHMSDFMGWAPPTLHAPNTR
jgi:putative membrane protein